MKITLLPVLAALLAARGGGAVAQPQQPPQPRDRTPPAPPWSALKDCVAGCGSGKSSEHCTKCADDPKEPSWSCGTCCSGYKLQKEFGGAYCVAGKGPSPPPPPGATYECWQGT